MEHDVAPVLMLAMVSKAVVSLTGPGVSGASADLVYAREPWEIDLGRRELRSRGAPVPLGSRAFEIVEVLVGSASELVTKDHLMHRVWPGAIVGEGTLHVHVSAIRKALGRDRHLLKTAQGRGYRLLGNWSVQHQAPTNSPLGPQSLAPESIAPEPRRLSTVLPSTNFPLAVTPLIGRSEAVQRVRDLVSAYRVVTLTGPGGIGKSTLALEATRGLLGEFEHGGWLVELASLSDADLIPSAVASALELKRGGERVTAESLARAIGEKHFLLLLDNCEHLIDAIANLVETVVRRCPRVTVVATSREVMRVQGESAYRVAALEVPGQGQQAGENILGHSAVELLITRAKALDQSFSPRVEDLASVAAICRRLDGIPLAIEFAAARAASLGVHEVAARLDDRFALLSDGRRTALPRQRTLRATLDWSHELLSEVERAVLRRLSVFVGGFTLPASHAVVSDEGSTSSELDAIVAGLEAKSLIAAEPDGEYRRFRLLETTHAYARSKLAESGEATAASRRHAVWIRDLMQTWSNTPAASAREIDNIRAALGWAFSSSGDRLLAIELAAASAPVWLQMSLLTDCLRWTELATERLDAGDRGTRKEMMLQSALGQSLMFTEGVSQRSQAAINRARELAQSARDFEQQFLAIIVHCRIRGRLQDFRGMLVLARQAKAIAEAIADPVAGSTADCWIGVSLFWLADYPQALSFAERASVDATPMLRHAQIGRYGIDHSMVARCVTARIRWLQGLLDQSAQINRDILADPELSGHPVSMCFALAWCGCPLSLLLGQLEIAEQLIARLKDQSELHALGMYYSCSLGLEGELAARRGDFAAAERLLRIAAARLWRAQEEQLHSTLLGSLIEVLANTGGAEKGLHLADEWVRRCERNELSMWMLEALRLKGVMLSLSDGADAIAAEDHFRRSLELAHRQGALSWELRSAMSLGRLLDVQGRTRDAVDLVGSVFGRFREGLQTTEVQSAQRLLEAWRLR